MIVIIGKNGQLAKKCIELLGKDKALALGSNEVDITSKSAFEVLDKHKPSAIINTSAYTAVDAAESNKAAAISINNTAVALLSEYCQTRNIHFVHVSTDYVFNGKKGSPYLPNDHYDPINVYGESKMLGEKAVLENAPSNSCILRTSWVYSEYGNNFVASILRLMEEKEQLGIIADQIGSPTSVNTLASACILASQQKLIGIHHVSDEGVASWYDFAKCIQRMALAEGLLAKQIPILPITSEQYPTPAKRPFYSVLCKQSIKAALPSLSLPYWQDALALVLAKIKLTNT